MKDITVELFQWVAFVVVTSQEDACELLNIHVLLRLWLRKAMLFSKAMACTWVMAVLSFNSAEMSYVLTLLGFVFSGPDAVSCWLGDVGLSKQHQETRN